MDLDISVASTTKNTSYDPLDDFMCEKDVISFIEETYSSDSIRKMIMRTTNALQTKMFFRDFERGDQLLADLIRYQNP